MRKSVILFLSCFTFVLSPLVAEDVVVLESMAGTESKYSVAELLRVELMGDSIRFIASDGSVAAEVYKYDYVKLTTADQPTTIEEPSASSNQPSAQKVLINGQVYILFADKAYLINGTKVR